MRGSRVSVEFCHVPLAGASIETFGRVDLAILTSNAVSSHCQLSSRSVWLWDWREGLNEAITTVRAILDLMDENKNFTYIRGESLLYRHIEETDPETFQRIVAYVKSGRWDVVGGTYIQPDTNLAGVENTGAPVHRRAAIF